MAKPRQTKQAIINRIRFANRSLPQGQRTSISKKQTVAELRQLERQTKVKKNLRTLGITATPEKLTLQQVRQTELIASAQRRGNTEELFQRIQSVKVKDPKISRDIRKLEKAKFLPTADYIQEVLKKDLTVDGLSESAKLENAKIQLQVLFSENPTDNFIKRELEKVNEGAVADYLGKTYTLDNIDELEEDTALVPVKVSPTFDEDALQEFYE